MLECVNAVNTVRKVRLRGKTFIRLFLRGQTFELTLNMLLARRSKTAFKNFTRTSLLVKLISKRTKEDKNVCAT